MAYYEVKPPMPHLRLPADYVYNPLYFMPSTSPLTEGHSPTRRAEQQRHPPADAVVPASTYLHRPLQFAPSPLRTTPMRSHHADHHRGSEQDSGTANCSTIRRSGGSSPAAVPPSASRRTSSSAAAGNASLRRRGRVLALEVADWTPRPSVPYDEVTDDSILRPTRATVLRVDHIQQCIEEREAAARDIFYRPTGRAPPAAGCGTPRGQRRSSSTPGNSFHTSSPHHSRRGSSAAERTTRSAHLRQLAALQKLEERERDAIEAEAEAGMLTVATGRSFACRASAQLRAAPHSRVSSSADTQPPRRSTSTTRRRSSYAKAEPAAASGTSPAATSGPANASARAAGRAEWRAAVAAGLDYGERPLDAASAASAGVDGLDAPAPLPRSPSAGGRTAIAARLPSRHTDTRRWSAPEASKFVPPRGVQAARGAAPELPPVLVERVAASESPEEARSPEARRPALPSPPPSLPKSPSASAASLSQPVFVVEEAPSAPRETSTPPEKAAMRSASAASSTTSESTIAFTMSSEAPEDASGAHSPAVARDSHVTEVPSTPVQQSQRRFGSEGPSPSPSGDCSRISAAPVPQHVYRSGEAPLPVRRLATSPMAAQTRTSPSPPVAPEASAEGSSSAARSQSSAASSLRVDTWDVTSSHSHSHSRPRGTPEELATRESSAAAAVSLHRPTLSPAPRMREIAANAYASLQPSSSDAQAGAKATCVRPAEATAGPVCEVFEAAAALSPREPFGMEESVHESRADSESQGGDVASLQSSFVSIPSFHEGGDEAASAIEYERRTVEAALAQAELLRRLRSANISQHGSAAPSSLALHDNRDDSTDAVGTAFPLVVAGDDVDTIASRTTDGSCYYARGSGYGAIPTRGLPLPPTNHTHAAAAWAARQRAAAVGSSSEASVVSDGLRRPRARGALHGGGHGVAAAVPAPPYEPRMEGPVWKEALDSLQMPQLQESGAPPPAAPPRAPAKSAPARVTERGVEGETGSSLFSQSADASSQEPPQGAHAASTLAGAVRAPPVKEKLARSEAQEQPAASPAPPSQSANAPSDCESPNAPSAWARTTRYTVGKAGAGPGPAAVLLGAETPGAILVHAAHPASSLAPAQTDAARAPSEEAGAAIEGGVSQPPAVPPHGDVDIAEGAAPSPRSPEVSKAATSPRKASTAASPSSAAEAAGPLPTRVKVRTALSNVSGSRQREETAHASPLSRLSASRPAAPDVAGSAVKLRVVPLTPTSPRPRTPELASAAGSTLPTGTGSFSFILAEMERSPVEWSDRFRQAAASAAGDSVSFADGDGGVCEPHSHAPTPLHSRLPPRKGRASLVEEAEEAPAPLPSRTAVGAAASEAAPPPQNFARSDASTRSLSTAAMEFQAALHVLECSECCEETPMSPRSEADGDGDAEARGQERGSDEGAPAVPGASAPPSADVTRELAAAPSHDDGDSSAPSLDTSPEPQLSRRRDRREATPLHSGSDVGEEGAAEPAGSMPRLFSSASSSYATTPAAASRSMSKSVSRADASAPPPAHPTAADVVVCEAPLALTPGTATQAATSLGTPSHDARVGGAQGRGASTESGVAGSPYRPPSPVPPSEYQTMRSLLSEQVAWSAGTWVDRERASASPDLTEATATQTSVDVFRTGAYSAPTVPLARARYVHTDL